MRFALSAFHSNIYHCDFFRQEKQYISAAVAVAVAFVFCIFSRCEKTAQNVRKKRIKILFIHTSSCRIDELSRLN